MANRAWPNRPLATVVIALAMLNVFTLGAGAAVASPDARRSWPCGTCPGSRAGRLTAAGQVLPGADGHRAAAHQPAAWPPPCPGLASPAALGAQTGLVVTDPASGRVLYANGAPTMLQPASTAKLATAVAALDVLGPAARFTTRVTAGGTRRLDRPGRRR